MKKYSTLLLVFISIYCHAQVITDLSSWTQVTLSYDVNKKNNLSFDEQCRADKSISHISTFNTDLEWKHNLNKLFDVSIGYRYSYKTENVSYHRFNLDLSYTYKKKKFQISDRLRYQKQFSVNPIDNYIRDKLSVKYKKLKKFTPEVAAEIFFHSNYKYNQFEQYRIYAGGAYKLNAEFSIELNYILLKEFNLSYPSLDNVIFLNVEYKIPSLKKKKKTS
ncbi:MAG: DUF2490 domain-containing protein [Ignavibacteria bacterium]|nr:DUF2490 domain-containing protein [Ignavibacteria bacterium]